MAKVSVNTVRSYWNQSLGAMSSQADALRAAGLDPSALAQAAVLERYGGDTVEVDDEQVVLSEENFDLVVATESDRLMAAAQEIVAQYEGNAEALLKQLSAVWAEATAALEEKDERLSLPKLPAFRAKFKRGGGGGGGAPEERDWSAGSWSTTGKHAGWTLIGNDGNGDEPSSFTVMDPDGEVIGDQFESASAAAMAVKEILGLKGRENGPRFFNVPKASPEGDDEDDE